MTNTVRQAGLHDLEQLVPLFDAYRQFYGEPSDLSRARQFLRDRLSRDESVVVIAQDEDGCAIGFVQLHRSFSSILAGSMYLLSDLYVAAKARRRGVGTRLPKSAVEMARTAGAVRLELATAITNAEAQRLYDELGWKREEFYQYGLSLWL